MSGVAKVKNAATVILLRAAHSGGFEVFLTRRPESMAFLGGLYVFPGGKVRRNDFANGGWRACHGISPAEARNILGAQMSPEFALGHWIAAIRELYEETGVLLAVDKKGNPIHMHRPEFRMKLAKKHAALLGREVDFQALLNSEELQCNATKLAYFSHWQTPETFTTRFDTRFFLATLPQDQIPLSTSHEVAHSVWLSPDTALRQFGSGDLPMIFPTFASLRTLADFESFSSLCREFHL